MCSSLYPPAQTPGVPDTAPVVGHTELLRGVYAWTSGTVRLQYGGMCGCSAAPTPPGGEVPLACEGSIQAGGELKWSAILRLDGGNAPLRAGHPAPALRSTKCTDATSARPDRIRSCHRTRKTNHSTSPRMWAGAARA